MGGIFNRNAKRRDPRVSRISELPRRSLQYGFQASPTLKVCRAMDHPRQGREQKSGECPDENSASTVWCPPNLPWSLPSRRLCVTIFNSATPFGNRICGDGDSYPASGKDMEKKAARTFP